MTASLFSRLAWARARAAAGFTLIELMVVLVIIGVLAALIVPNVLDRTDDARAPVATGPGAACDIETIGVNWKNAVGGLSTLQFYHGAIYPGGNAYLGGAQDNGGSRGSDPGGPRAWTTITTGDGGRSVIDSLDPNILYVAAQLFDLDKSVDGGGSFRVSLRGLTEPKSNFAFVAPFAGDPNDSRRLWTAGNRIWTSANSADD